MPTSPVCTIDATGIHVPDFNTVLTYFQTAYRGIYGQDVVLDNATQDGQFLALIALALHEANGATAAAYNAFSPSTAQGVGLSSVVKVNGIARSIPTYSTVDLTMIGQAGEIVIDGVARDANSTAWLLPSPITFPPSGQIVVTATAATAGAIEAPANTVTTIATPTKGWQSVTNGSAATPGLPIESDADLRRRQSLSTALPAASGLEGLIGAVSAIPGVSRLRAYENDTGVQDTNGLPGNTVALVVDGGDVASICQTMSRKKQIGVGFYGNTGRSLADAYGIPHQIRFFRPAQVPVAYYLTVRAFDGYTRDVEAAIRQALVEWTNNLGIGEPLRITRAYLPANLYGGALSASYEILGLVATRSGLPPVESGDLPAAFAERLACVADAISIQVVTP